MLVSPANEISDTVLYTGKLPQTRKEDTLAPKKQSPLDKIIDKAQEKRRGGKAPGFLDKAQKSGLTEKLGQRGRGKLFGRRSSTNR
jgi:hypothetical protein